MVKRILIALLLSIGSLHAENMVNAAIDEYEKGNSVKAISILKEISPNSGQFKRSVETLIKIYYKEGVWARVFGLGTWYRQKFSNHAEFSMDVASLEVLALAQNCRYGIAELLLNSLEVAHGQKQAFKKLKENFKVAKNYGLKESAERETKLNKVSGERWKLDKDEFGRLGDPFRLEVKLENKCKS